MNVLLTHGKGRLEGLEAALVRQGFEVAHIPLVRTEPLPAAKVRSAAEALLNADWLLFTSRTAVSAWVELDLPLSNIVPKIGVVGEKTRAEVVRLGGEITLTAEPASARGLLEKFQARITPPASVGLPCGEEALPTLASGLTRAGFDVKRVHLYRTVTQPLESTDADIVVLASPSAVTALPRTLGSRTHFVALGPSTYSALRERGLEAVQSERPDVHSVVRAVMQMMSETLLETP